MIAGHRPGRAIRSTRSCLQSPACLAAPGTHARGVVVGRRFPQGSASLAPGGAPTQGLPPPPCERTHQTPPGPPSGRTPLL
ncbi:hypothetical protein DQ392_31545 [Streptomyces reniochalinae]|uniref:Uncharacterized protein n=1 Tax=Streptomyces reniochalinae TaxID=2250578 RepID=A0A367E6N8_9ACTN|nr:hypothetical protein DQ392_31545 [Streptomyces reniochalinae]